MKLDVVPVGYACVIGAHAQGGIWVCLSKYLGPNLVYCQGKVDVIKVLRRVFSFVDCNRIEGVLRQRFN